MRGTAYTQSRYSPDFIQKRTQMKKLMIYGEGVSVAGAASVTPDFLQSAAMQVAGSDTSPLAGIEVVTQYGGTFDQAAAAAKAAGADAIPYLNHRLRRGQFIVSQESYSTGSYTITTTRWLDDVPFMQFEAKGTWLADLAPIFDVKGYSDAYVKSLGGGQYQHDGEGELYVRALDGALERFAVTDTEQIRHYRLDIDGAGIPTDFIVGAGFNSPLLAKKIVARPFMIWGQWNYSQNVPAQEGQALLVQLESGGKIETLDDDSLEWTSLRLYWNLISCMAESRLQGYFAMGWAMNTRKLKKDQATARESDDTQGFVMDTGFDIHINRVVSIRLGMQLDLSNLSGDSPFPIMPWVIGGSWHF